MSADNRNRSNSKNAVEDVDSKLKQYMLINKQISRTLTAQRVEIANLKNAMRFAEAEEIRLKIDCHKWKNKFEEILKFYINHIQSLTAELQINADTINRVQDVMLADDCNSLVDQIFVSPKSTARDAEDSRRVSKSFESTRNRSKRPNESFDNMHTIDEEDEVDMFADVGAERQDSSDASGSDTIIENSKEESDEDSKDSLGEISKSFPTSNEALDETQTDEQETSKTDEVKGGEGDAEKGESEEESGDSELESGESDEESGESDAESFESDAESVESDEESGESDEESGEGDKESGESDGLGEISKSFQTSNEALDETQTDEQETSKTDEVKGGEGDAESGESDEESGESDEEDDETNGESVQIDQESRVSPDRTEVDVVSAEEHEAVSRNEDETLSEETTDAENNSDSVEQMSIITADDSTITNDDSDKENDTANTSIYVDSISKNSKSMISLDSETFNKSSTVKSLRKMSNNKRRVIQPDQSINITYGSMEGKSLVSSTPYRNASSDASIETTIPVKSSKSSKSSTAVSMTSEMSNSGSVASSRPKRKAAPVVLSEPKLNTKLRRPR